MGHDHVTVARDLQGTADIDTRLEEQMIDGILYAFQVSQLTSATPPTRRSIILHPVSSTRILVKVFRSVLRVSFGTLCGTGYNHHTTVSYSSFSNGRSVRSTDTERGLRVAS